MILEKIPIMDLLPGDSLIYEKTGFISRAIQIMTRSKFNHASMIDKSYMIHEAIEEGYKTRTLFESIDKDTKRIVVKRPKKKIDLDLMESIMFEMKDAKYEFAGIWYEIKHQFWGGWKGDKEVKKNVFCSKANAYIFLNAFKMLDYLDIWFETSPDTIFEDFINFDTFELQFKK